MMMMLDGFFFLFLFFFYGMLLFFRDVYKLFYFYVFFELVPFNYDGYCVHHVSYAL